MVPSRLASELLEQPQHILVENLGNEPGQPLAWVAWGSSLHFFIFIIDGFFFQGQLYGLITAQQETPRQELGMEKLMENDYICGNDTEQGLSRYRLATLLRNDSEKETLTKRKKRISKKLKKRKK